MSDADRLNMAYIEEVTFGTTPATPALIATPNVGIVTLNLVHYIQLIHR